MPCDFAVPLVAIFGYSREKRVSSRNSSRASESGGTTPNQLSPSCSQLVRKARKKTCDQAENESSSGPVMARTEVILHLQQPPFRTKLFGTVRCETAALLRHCRAKRLEQTLLMNEGKLGSGSRRPRL